MLPMGQNSQAIDVIGAGRWFRNLEVDQAVTVPERRRSAAVIASPDAPRRRRRLPVELFVLEFSACAPERSSTRCDT